MRLLKSEQLAEETLQEVFLKIWRMEQSLNELSNFDAYLKTLTRNRCLNILRGIIRANKNNEKYTRTLDQTHNETEEAIILNDTRKALQEAINQLPPQQREVYLLCHEQGLKYEQAAKQLNISTLTVKTHMQRALKSLRTYLKNHNDIAAVLILLKLF